MATTTPSPNETNNPAQESYEDLVQRESHASNYHQRQQVPAGDPFDPRVDASREDLKQREEAPSEPVHEDQLGNGYVPSSKLTGKDKLTARKWVFTKRRAALGGGIIGTIIAILIFFVGSGPLEFVHIAQLMEQFHFSAQEDQSDDRFMKLARFIKYGSSDELQKTRLGYFQNKMADRIETKMNAAGIESAYSDTFKFGDGYIIDPEKLSSSEFKDLQGKSADEIKKYFKDSFNVDISDKLPSGGSVPKGKFFVDSRSLGFFKNGRLIRAMATASGYSKVSSAVGARVMGKRYGIDWHPIKKLDNKIFRTAEARYAEWKKERAAKIEKGVNAEIELRSTPPEDDKAAAGNANSAAGESNQTVKEGQDTRTNVTDGDTGALSKFQSSLSGKLALKGVAAAGILCVAKGLDSSADAIKQEQVVLPLARMGMDAVTTGNQVMNGKDADTEQLGFYKKFLNGKDSSGKNTSWIQAQSIQAELGHSTSGSVGKPDSTLTTISKNSPFHFLNEDGFNTALTPICSPVGTAAQVVISFFGGPISALSGMLVSQALGPPVMDALAHWLAGTAVDPFKVGADYGNYIDYGTTIAANGQAISHGGRALSNNESQQLAVYEDNQSEQEFQDHGLAYKLLNPYDDRSAISKVIDMQSPSVSQNLASLSHGLLNFTHMFSSLPKLFASTAHAQPVPYDYGFAQYGFSVAEMNNPAVNNPYKNADDVVNNILPNYPKYIDRANKCFGVAIDPGTYDISDFNAGDPKYSDTDTSECKDSSTNWLKVRFYIFDTQNMEASACFEGEDLACSDIGFDDSSQTTSGAPQAESSPSSNVQDLAQQILNNSNVSFPLDAISSNGSTKVVLQTLAKGDKAPVTCTDGSTGGVTSTDVNPNILQFILALAAQGKVGVNAITDKCHTTGSNHYKGKAVDFECMGVPFDVSKADAIASKYGGKRNSETCSGNSHWHYDFL